MGITVSNLDASLSSLRQAARDMDELAVDYTDRRMPAECAQVLRDLYTVREIMGRLERLQAADRRR